MVDDARLHHLSQEVVSALLRRGVMLATAESCTGGMIAAAITDIAGSSAVFDRGFVTYSNAAKAEAIGVDADAIRRYGAVSETVARQMAEGALRSSCAGIAVSVTGVAGPGGGSDEKPVGLVHFGCASLTGETRHREMRFGDLGRAGIRRETVRVALEMVLEALSGDRQAGEPPRP